MQRFAEINSFPNVVQPGMEYPFSDHFIKGNWKSRFFMNDKPIVLEIGCGKGEYTIALSKEFPEYNFLGLDIKGDRIWVGAKFAMQEALSNVGFLRAQAEHLNCFFSSDEVDEIWITFPDPQPNKPRTKKRLTSPKFIDIYRAFLKHDGLVHLKTDCKPLYHYTLDTIKQENCKLLFATEDLYGNKEVNNKHVLPTVFSVQTYYEKMFLKKGESITYTRFQLNA